MTKADYIRQLAKHGFSDKRIQKMTEMKFGYCAASYVRVVARQRLHGQSIHDIRYAQNFKAQHGISPSAAWQRCQHG